MNITNPSHSGRLKKSAFFFVCLALELMVFAILPLSARLPVNQLLYAQVGLSLVLLFATYLLRKNGIGEDYWQLAFVLLVACVAVLSSTLFSGRLLDLFQVVPASPQWIALAKLSESILRVVPILTLMAIIGADRRSIYLSRGSLGLGLAVGIAGFAAFAGLAFMPLAKDPGSTGKLLSLSPWILIFVLANGFSEELLFRALFLKRFEPFLGPRLSNLLTAVVFTLVHVQVTYVSDLLQFLSIVFPLALIWGYLMQRTNGLWGSALFHAGADCMIIFGIFASAP